MLQIFYLYVSKIDQVTHLLQLLGSHRAGVDVRAREEEGARAGGQTVQACVGAQNGVQA